MKILGVDPGTGRLGWAIIEKFQSHNLRLIACGLIETPAKTKLDIRLEVIFDQLSKVIDKFKPDQLAIEELFFVKNVKTGISVSHARGVAMLCCRKSKMEIFEYKPNEIKLGIAGHGHADKKQMAKMLKLHLKGCSIEQDDTADAIAVALYHLQIKRYKNLS